MLQVKITGSQFTDEIHRPHAVRDSVEHLQVDAAAVIADPEQIQLAALGVNIAAGPGGLLFYIRRAFVAFKVIPEKTPL